MQAACDTSIVRATVQVVHDLKKDIFLSAALMDLESRPNRYYMYIYTKQPACRVMERVVSHTLDGVLGRTLYL